MKTSTSFTSFHLIHSIELVIPIKCEISTLHNVLNILPDTTPMEQHLLHLECLNEDQRDFLQHNESHKACVESHFDIQVPPRAFSPSDLVLTFDVAKDKNLGLGKFTPL